MSIKALAGATIVTPDLAAAIAAYGEYLGYRGEAPAPVGGARAVAWGAPAAADAHMVTLYPESGEDRFLRLVQGRPARDYRPMGSLGWNAVELVVQDIDALAARLAESPFDIIGAPAVLDFDFTDKIRAMQVAGPGGEVLYLTQIDAEIPGFDLPSANSFVGLPFIMVLGGRAIVETAAPYDQLGRPAGPTIAARIEVLSRAHDIDPAFRHSLATIALDDRSLIEVDAFPDTAGPRPLSSIGLPSGIAMASFTTDGRDPDPSLAASVIRGAAGELIELILQS